MRAACFRQSSVPAASGNDHHMPETPTEDEERVATTPAETVSPDVAGFRGTRWSTRWLVVGVAVLLLFRAVSFADRTWFSRVPPWLLMAIAGLTFQAFFLIFPLLTRKRGFRPEFRLPRPTRFLKEFGLAVPVVIGTFVALGVANYFLSRIWPGTSLTPQAIKNMAQSPSRTFVLLVLLFSFTCAPIAEEVFFRGFLHNAFRARMPLLVAGLAQSLIFGFSHSFGSMHAGVACVLGLLLTAVYEWRKTLIAPILVHCGINFVSALGTVALMIVHATSPEVGVIGDAKDTECVIRQIVPNSAAEKAGLQVGDVIRAFNGGPIRNFRHLRETVPLYRPGDALPVRINRSGRTLEVTVVLQSHGDSPQETPTTRGAPPDGGVRRN